MKTNQKGSVELLVVIIVLSIVIFGLYFSNQTDIARLEKHDKCLKQVIQIYPDVNYEIEERKLLLSNCMDK